MCPWEKIKHYYKASLRAWWLYLRYMRDMIIEAFCNIHGYHNSPYLETGCNQMWISGTHIVCDQYQLLIESIQMHSIVFMLVIKSEIIVLVSMKYSPWACYKSVYAKRKII